jgi:nucleoside phosphorylase
MDSRIRDYDLPHRPGQGNEPILDALADHDMCSVIVSGSRDSSPVPDLGEDMVANPAVPIVVVLTAIPVEYAAVREHLLDIQEEVHEAGTVFHVGRLRNIPWLVVLAWTGQGNHRAAALTERAISSYQPDLAMLVGVAGRLHDDLSLGDVVVARKVYAIHGGTVNRWGFRPRPETWSPRHGQIQRAERIAESGVWRDAVPGQSRSDSKAVVRPIASGEIVLNTRKRRFAKSIKKYFDDAAAIEMEGAGFALAAQLNESLPVVVLRGISDFADGRKEDADRAGWQQQAVRNAAAFAVTLLADLVPTHAVEEHLLSGNPARQILAVGELGSGRYTNAVPLLVKGFHEVRDPDMSCRIVWALTELGTEPAKDALRALQPRYDIERLVIQDALDGWREQP